MPWITDDITVAAFWLAVVAAIGILIIAAIVGMVQHTRKGSEPMSFDEWRASQRDDEETQ